MRIFILLLATLALALSAQAEKRIALVIGNSDYDVKGWDLANPVNDADLISSKLRSVGFDVHTIKDASLDDMGAAFKAHGDRLKAAGKDAVGFFYYAGHGVQSEGLNYLVPVDMVAYNEADVWHQAPYLGMAMRHMKRAGNQTNFVVLDACRNNPLPSASRTTGGGLQALRRSRGTLIAYATQPGAVAADGKGYENSPFTDELARLITQPGLSAESLFRNVATKVEFRTDNRQQPWYESGLRGAKDFCFAGCGSGAQTNDEASALSIALASGELARLEEFRSLYPESLNRSLVDQQIAALKAKTTDRTSQATSLNRQTLPKQPQMDRVYNEAIKAFQRKDYDQAYPLYKRACENNHARSCNNLGHLYLKGLGVAMDAEHAFSLIEKSCNAGHMSGCKNLGTMYLNGHGVPVNKVEAKRLHKKACDGGDQQACNHMTVANYDDQSAQISKIVYEAYEAYKRKDYDQAYPLYKIACENNDARSCNNLGQLYLEGLGVAKDAEYALSLIEKSCDAGHMWGCKNLGTIYLNGHGVPVNKAEAKRLHKKACDGGAEQACKIMTIANYD